MVDEGVVTQADVDEVVKSFLPSAVERPEGFRLAIQEV